MVANPLVSILIPAYNSEKWIRATINSALAQTWKKTEIIIINDGSSDSTFEVAKEFESKSVKVISQENRGASAARNHALSFAQGDFIQWLDSDDILANNKIELQLKSSGFNPQTKILHSSAWGFFYHSLKRAKFIANPLWQDLAPVNWLKYHLGEGYFMYPAVWLVSRSLTEQAGLWNEKLSLNDDGEYFCRVVASCEKVCFNSDVISYHRVGNLTSLSSGQSSPKALESYNLSLNLCVDYLLGLENSESTRKACIRSLQKIIKMIDLNNSSIVKSNQRRIVELGGTITSVPRTRKFKIVQNLLGVKTTTSLKTNLWNIEILIRKYWDRLLSLYYKDAV